MIYRPKYCLSLVFLALLALSCVEEQNFDQYDDIAVTPSVESSIIYVETPESIINQAVGVNFYSQVFNFDAFSEEFFAERVLDGTITYEVENTTSKALDITIDFLDDADNLLDSESFTVDPAPTAVLVREINYGGPTGRSLDIIRNTSAIRVSATNQGDNTSVSSLPDPKIVLRSSGMFRLRLK